MEINDAIIEKIKGLNLKKLSNNELISLSQEIRKYIIETTSVNGGHLASNLGVVELTLALHRAFDFPKDKLIFDVGHQSYTHKVLTGRSLKRLRKEDGIAGFQKRSESIYDPYDAGHSSTSISAAMGMALDRDLNKENYHIISLIGDASLANGMAFEALNNIKSFHHKIIIVINDNDMSISNSTGALHDFLQKIRLSNKYLNFKESTKKQLSRNSFTRFFSKRLSNIKSFFKRIFLRNSNIFEMFGCYYIPKVDGYDFKSMQKAFQKAKRLDSSVVIHVSTIKGKGYKFSESDKVSSWHSVKPFDLTTGKPLVNKNDNEISWSSVYSTFLDYEMRNKESIIVNPATMVGSKIQSIHDMYPDKTIDVGISEEHAVTLASGISISNNRHTFVSIYSSFLQRAYDQINHDIARMDVHVTFLIDRAGLVGEDGETHQGIFDESFLLNMPNVAVTMAKNYHEAKALFIFSREYKHPLAIRYPIGNTLKFETKDILKIEYGKWIIENISENKNLALISFGPKLNDILYKYNDLTIINAIFQKPLDQEVLKMLLDYKNIIVYDPYAIKEGFCYHVLAKLNDLSYQGNVKLIGLENEFITKASIQRQEEYNHVDLTSLYELIDKLK